MSDDLAPLPVELLHAQRGYALAWSAPWGAAASIVQRFAPEYARPPIPLGTSDRTRSDAPRLFHVDEGIACVWCQDDGAWLAIIGDDGRGLVRAPERVAAGARSVAIAPSRGETHVLTEDGESVRVLVVKADGTLARAPEPLIVQHGRVRLAAARAGEAPLLVAAYASERRLIVADATRGRASLVRHDLPGDVTALDAHGAGARVAFALVYDDGELVEAAVLDRAGKLVERRHVVLRETGARYADVRVTWIEDDFHVVARDASTDRAIVVAVGSAKRVLEITKVRGPFAVGYQEKGLSLAQVFADGDTSVLRVTRELRDPSVREVREPAPPTLRVRRAEEQTVRCFDELERMLGTAGYRDARAVRVAVPTGAALRLESEGQHVELRPDGESFRLTLVALEDGITEPARDGSVERLARWVRERVSGDAKAHAERDHALGVALAGALEAALVHVERNESGLRFELMLSSIPAAQRLSAWLHRARTLLAQR
ncbi:hypothetical protein [Sandaracinus amylolyticus]|uniref:Uncharacterized protein n=1 Tax=Sandaracinus amylolyticus TaxID=927083 RepID=A0A0F6SGB9_9BACT|nr:hypothetical protein [Sandaracinus amylolyticus]AKF08424.1 hypothetical protein DB32_005573 [Sandaracinus amylolyticus]